MAGAINHKHAAITPDDPSADVKASDWNASLKVSGGTDGQVMSRDSSSTDGWKLVDRTLANLSDVNAPTPTDGQALVYQSASSKWVPGSSGIVTVVPPDDTQFSWVNQGGASVVVTAGKCIFLSAPAVTGNNLRARVMAAPATPWTLTVGIIPAIVDFNFAACGVCFRESGSGKIATFHFANNTTKQLIPQKYTSPTVFSANYVTTDYTMMGAVMWLRLQDNGTNRICSVSNDGLNFKQIHSVGRTDFLTADQVGFCADSSNTTLDVGMTVVSWSF